MDNSITQTPENTVLQVIEVQVKRGERSLLNKVNFTVKAGEFIAVAGENGCGKSTLLSTICGGEGAFRALVSGKIYVHDMPLEHYSAQQLATMRAVMCQHQTSPFGFLVDEVLTLARHAMIEPSHIRRGCIATVSDALDLSHLLHRNIQTLSGGEQQRVYLAKALLQLVPSSLEDDLTGKLLLLDEPTSALDLRHQKLVMGLLAKLSQHGLSIICISHDINLVTPYCTRMLVLANQGVIADGAPADVLDQRILKQCYQTDLHLIKHPEHGVFVTH